MLCPERPLLPFNSQEKNCKLYRYSQSQFAKKNLNLALIALFSASAIFFQNQAFAQNRPVGIDVSDYQSASINWSTLKNTYSIVFGWAKASEGTSTNAGGTHFGTYAVNAHNAGVILGGYHFARYDLDPGTSGAATEAHAFWNAIKPVTKTDGFTLIPMLDMEWTNTSGYTKTTMSQWVNSFCTTLTNDAYAAGFVLKPCIYTSGSYASTWFDSTVTVWYLDKAQWHYSLSSAQSGTPTTSPWSGWQFWQYDDTNNAQAYTGGDGDIFNGTYAQMQATMTVLPAGLPVITLQPSNNTIWLGSNATFSVQSTNATHYQWTFNQTNIAGATSSNYTILNADLTNAGAYSCTLSNSKGNLASATAYLAVVPILTNIPGAIVAPTGIVDYWPADGNANDVFGTVQGFPAGNFFYSTGISGQAFHFDGATTFVSNNAANIAAPWTACLWVNFSHTPQPTGSAGLFEDGTYSLKLEQYGSATHNVGISQLGYADSTFNYAAPNNTWVHLAFVATSSSVTLYANGVSKGSITTNGMPLPRKYVGAGYVTSSAKYIDQMFGSLDEIILFNRALSPAEITSIYNAGSAGLVRTPEVLGYDFNAAGQFIVNLMGLTGKIYTIHTSTNMIDWVSAGVLSNVNGTNQYIVNNALGTPTKFYRFSQPY